MKCMMPLVNFIGMDNLLEMCNQNLHHFKDPGKLFSYTILHLKRFHLMSQKLFTVWTSHILNTLAHDASLVDELAWMGTSQKDYNCHICSLD